MIKPIPMPDNSTQYVFDMDAAWNYYLKNMRLEEDKLSNAEHRFIKMAFYAGLTTMFSTIMFQTMIIPTNKAKVEFFDLLKTQLDHCWRDANKAPLSKKI